MENKVENMVTISSRVRLARNFQGYPFPNKLSDEKSYEILEKVKRVFHEKGFKKSKFTYVDVGLLDPINRLMLVERHIISPELFSKNRPCGLVLSEDESMGIMVNEEDHLRIQSILPGLDLRSAMKLCMEVDETLENTDRFYFDEKLGYLTACPTNIGTGMRASVMLHLPALTATGVINEVIQACVRLGLTARGMYGEHSEAIGNMFQISNQKSLGYTEEGIVNNVLNIVEQIIEREIELRNDLYSKSPHRFEDKVMRAYGILTNSRIITTEESIRLLSEIRLGVDMGLLPNIERSLLDYLIVSIQPASLQKIAGRPIDSEERDVYRAGFIRNALGESGKTV